MQVELLPTQKRTQHITVDVEEWFHILGTPVPELGSWDTLPSTVERNINLLLKIFEKNKLKCTFFTLGWIAKKYPQLIAKIASQGHEIASHGYFHDDVRMLTIQQFSKDIKDTKYLLEDITGQEIIGYRSPGFSAGKEKYLIEIAKAGYLYDSSIFPANRDEGGNPGMPCVPYNIQWSNGLSIYEFPVSVTNIMHMNVPSGGGYFRICPQFAMPYVFNKIIKESKGYMLFYIHPREIDEGQHPKLHHMTILKKFKTYINLNGAKDKFEWLCSNSSSVQLASVIGKS